VEPTLCSELGERLATIDGEEVTACCVVIMDCADLDLIKFVDFMVNHCEPANGETYATAMKLGQELLDNCRDVVGQPPLFRDGEIFFPGMHQSH